ncbi:MAG TPA: hypothetical protein VFN55_07240 [Solirubrobacteraceae bacterium]|nr:hypothetical protein [Solirubrobacteraceae bacterium]
MILTGAAGAIGATALYLLFIWLASAAAAAWMAERKGYGERLGLTFGLVLTFVGFILVLLLPGRPGSAWKLEGPLPRRGSADRPAVEGPVMGGGDAVAEPGDAPPPADLGAPPADPGAPPADLGAPPADPGAPPAADPGAPPADPGAPPAVDPGAPPADPGPPPPADPPPAA